MPVLRDFGFLTRDSFLELVEHTYNACHDSTHESLKIADLLSGPDIASQTIDEFLPDDFTYLPNQTEKVCQEPVDLGVFQNLNGMMACSACAMIIDDGNIGIFI